MTEESFSPFCCPVGVCHIWLAFRVLNKDSIFAYNFFKKLVQSEAEPFSAQQMAVAGRGENLEKNWLGFYSLLMTVGLSLSLFF